MLLDSRSSKTLNILDYMSGGGVKMTAMQLSERPGCLQIFSHLMCNLNRDCDRGLSGGPGLEVVDTFI